MDSDLIIYPAPVMPEIVGIIESQGKLFVATKNRMYVYANGVMTLIEWANPEKNDAGEGK